MVSGIRTHMRRFFVRSIWLPLAVVVLVTPCCSAYQAKAKAAEDKPQSPIEVHEWSIWVGNPAQTSVNASRIYKNAMPGVAGTSRPKLRGKGTGQQVPDRADFGSPVLRRALLVMSTWISGPRKALFCLTGR